MRIITFLLLIATGLGMALPGLWLVLLGGSFYYVTTGLLILACAILALQRSRFAALSLYGFVFLGTLLWSLWEVGPDGWALMPRLVYLFVGGLWLFLWSSSITRAQLVAMLLPLLVLFGAAALIFSSHTNPVASEHPAEGFAGVSGRGEWTHYGNSEGGTRYSPLAQIAPANAGGLVQAWEYHTGRFGHDKHSAHQLEVTPLMVDGLLYGCNAHSAVFALDPVTGKEIWRHDSKIDPNAGGRGVCRGVSFFRAPAGTSECATRLLVGTVDNRLVAVDAKTGASCRSFGKDGTVDLSEGEGLEPATRGWITPTSPPAIVHGTVVIGSFVVDNAAAREPPGVVRGYDAVNGHLKWAFDPGKPDEHGPPPAGQSYTPSTPNAWAPFSGDEKLGLVYVPMGNGSPDWFGGLRTSQTDRFTDAIVALDADTGELRWEFQTVHHDLWDYDLAAQPVLVDFPTSEGNVPALIQATKSGQIFVLDRRSGRPLTKVEEKPVPASTVPGERTAPTQPYSTGMPDFSGPTLTEADMWGVTPFDQLYCRIKFRQAAYHGMYTPVQLGPSISAPGELGGIDWGSVSVDEGRGLLIVNSNLMANRDELISREQANREHLFTNRNPRSKGAPPPPQRGSAMEGTPYGLHLDGFMGLFGVPCQRPPYGYLSAVNLKTGKLVWQTTLGNASNSGPWGYPLHLSFPLGTPNIGGSLVTAGGVIFIAATQDKLFRAVDERSGKVLWEVKLPAGGHATPMTYLGRDRKQYVLIAAGGWSVFGTGSSDALVAYRLP